MISVLSCLVNSPTAADAVIQKCYGSLLGHNYQFHPALSFQKTKLCHQSSFTLFQRVKTNFTSTRCYILLQWEHAEIAALKGEKSWNGCNTGGWCHNVIKLCHQNHTLEAGKDPSTSCLGEPLNAALCIKSNYTIITQMYCEKVCQLKYILHLYYKCVRVPTSCWPDIEMNRAHVPIDTHPKVLQNEAKQGTQLVAVWFLRWWVHFGWFVWGVSLPVSALRWELGWRTHGRSEAACCSAGRTSPPRYSASTKKTQRHSQD